MGGFVEISIYLLATCKGIIKFFGYEDYRFIVTPTTLLVVNLSYFEFDSITSYFEWSIETWPYYSFLFQVILPIIILVVVEIKKKQLVKPLN